MKCRICSKEIETPLISLGNMPLSNSLVINPFDYEQYYPLILYLCKDCNFLMIPEFGLAKNIFSDNYPYFSSYSETWLEHCRLYADNMVTKYKFNNESLVIEIGSNDGHLLKYFKNNNIQVLGIESSKSVANKANKDGITTYIGYFDKEYALKLKNENKQADLIIGNNVLAHNPNLNNFVEGLSTLLKPDGIITLEFPYLLNLIAENQFDTIYQEHYSYFSFFAIRKLLRSHKLTIFNVEEIPTHGGSLRIYAKHKSCPTYPVITSNTSYILNKDYEQLNSIDYQNFIIDISLIKRSLLKILIDLKYKNKTIIGYGAPAKGNTLLNYCGISTDFIDYVVDKSEFKQGKYLPGSHIPIKSPNIIKTDKPDYILILPWNIKDEIIKQLSYTKEWNCKFIIPIPFPNVINEKQHSSLIY